MNQLDFQIQVRGMLSAIGQCQDRVDARFVAIHPRFDGITGRRDGQDTGVDDLTAGVDRRTVLARFAFGTSEQARGALVPVHRRADRLERPDGSRAGGSGGKTHCFALNPATSVPK